MQSSEDFMLPISPITANTHKENCATKHKPTDQTSLQSNILARVKTLKDISRVLHTSNIIGSLQSALRLQTELDTAS
jgi:transcriptional regulator of NAD metabolism